VSGLFTLELFDAVNGWVLLNKDEQG